MNRPNLRRTALLAVCALLLLSGLRLPARAAHQPVRIHIDGVPLADDSRSFIHNGTAYVPLVAFARAMGEYEVFWTRRTARLTSPELTLTATPGQAWVEANGRCLYVSDGVLLVSGRTMVPARTLAQIFTARIAWDEEAQTVFVSDSGGLLTSGAEHYDEQTLYWLSRVISAESQGEELLGQIAVGNVVLDRMESEVFPNDLYQVIFQPGQFEPVENGTIYNEPYYLSVIAAKLCLEGAQAVADCMYFFAPDLSPGTWIVNNRTYYTTIGCHRFYL